MLSNSNIRKRAQNEHASYLGQDKCQGQWRMKRDDRDLKWRAGATGAWPGPLKDRAVLRSMKGGNRTERRQRQASGFSLPEKRILCTKPFQSGIIREDEIWSTLLSTQVTFPSLSEATGTIWILRSMCICFVSMSTWRKAKTKWYRDRKLRFSKHPQHERCCGWRVLCLFSWMLEQHCEIKFTILKNKKKNQTVSSDLPAE